MALTVIILTYNESLHIRRVLENVIAVANDVVVVDSFSTDDTVSVATSMGARVFQHPFVSHAGQLQWAMENTGITSDWVMRMDADELITTDLANEIKDKLSEVPKEVSGIILKRRVHFMGKWIRYGGYYPVRLLRIWRYGHVAVEQRWMDEHIYLLQGKSVEFAHDIIDDNLNNLSWWINKHNDYATREAMDVLNREFRFFEKNNNAVIKGQPARKRWYKNNLYLRLPLLIRACLYFHFRYFILLGFLDGRKGLVWHFLQGFWYRFLVDAKIMQIKWMAKEEGISVQQVLQDKFKVKNL